MASVKKLLRPKAKPWYHRDFLSSDAPRRSEQLTITDCSSWIGRPVVIPLKHFTRPQVGTIKYVGHDCAGVLCAGIEFDSCVQGMSGKVNGQKLFKCKPKHGLFIPVNYVQFLDEYERNPNFVSARRSPQPTIAPSTTNLSRPNAATKTTKKRIFNPELAASITFMAVSLQKIKCGDYVVWLGAGNPMSGEVKWTGRPGGSSELPLKAWIDMDEPSGDACIHDGQDIGVEFGCTEGHGRFLPVDELTLIQDYLPPENSGTGEVEKSKQADFSERLEPSMDLSLQVSPSNHNADSYNFNDSGAGSSLIQLVPGLLSPAPPADSIQQTQSGQSNDLFDSIFSEIMTSKKDERSSVTPKGVSKSKSTAFQTGPTSPTAANIPKSFSDDLFKAFCAPTTLSNGSSTITSPLAPTNPFFADILNASSVSSPADVSKPLTPDSYPNTERPNVLSPMGTSSGQPLSSYSNSSAEKKSENIAKNNLNDTDDMLPPFIVPPMEYDDFVSVIGTKGIQSSNNSCYIDVVLLSLFGFTSKFEDVFMRKQVGEDSDTKYTRYILFDRIVNPLRQDYYCSADAIHHFRDRLLKFSPKIQGGFLDAEEFMTILFQKAFKLPPFIQYDSKVSEFFHHVQYDHDDLRKAFSTQECFERSMNIYGLKLNNVPDPALVMLMPRDEHNFDKQPIIVPNRSLDLSAVTGIQVAGNRKMTLASVLCIRDHHYVAFIRGGYRKASDWIFFDPGVTQFSAKVEPVPDLDFWIEKLEKEVSTDANKVFLGVSFMPSMIQRFLQDMYVCIYI